MPEQALRNEIQKTIVIYEQAIGLAATRTRKMIRDYGEIEALSRLMVSADLQQGFRVLRDTHQIGKTFESLVVRFRHLFAPEVVRAAQWRLAHPNDLL